MERIYDFILLLFNVLKAKFILFVFNVNHFVVLDSDIKLSLILISNKPLTVMHITLCYWLYSNVWAKPVHISQEISIQFNSILSYLPKTLTMKKGILLNCLLALPSPFLSIVRITSIQQSTKLHNLSPLTNHSFSSSSRDFFCYSLGE